VLLDHLSRHDKPRLEEASADSLSRFQLSPQSNSVCLKKSDNTGEHLNQVFRPTTVAPESEKQSGAPPCH
jgi:hypothetical protein